MKVKARVIVASVLVVVWLGSSGVVDYAATTTSSDEASKNTAKQLQGTVVFQLQGELGNHIAALAYYYAVKTIASTEFNLNLTLHVRKQKLGRGRKQDYTAKHAKSCLKSFQDLDFDECDWNQALDTTLAVNASNPIRGAICDGKIREQSQFWGEHKVNNTLSEWASSLILKEGSSEQIRPDLRNYAAMLQDRSIMDAYRQRGLGWNSDEPHPFLYNTDMLHAQKNKQLIHEFWGPGLANFLAFDKNDTQCCDKMPEEDEHLFHFRSFKADLPNPGKLFGWGFAELKPDPAADLLAKHIPKGSKVTIVSGRSVGNRTAMYKEAFEKKSFIVREAPRQSGTQDFCFLSHAQASLWGVEKSTYATWAALTNLEVQNATLYGVSYPSRSRQISLEDVPSLNEELAKVVHFPILIVSDDDVW